MESTNTPQAVLDTLIDSKRIFGTSFAVKHNNRVWTGTAGNLSIEQPYFVASTTKLFITALVLNLRSKDRLQLDDTIDRYLEPSVISGLHVHKGKDYSHEITIRHLLSHTSGLPDYFEDKGKNGKSLEDELVLGNDQSWTFEDCIKRSKHLSSHFRPGQKKKAHYSDTNFQLLGKIIETITSQSIAENIDTHIVKPLGLASTYLYHDIADKRPHPLYYKSQAIHVPQAMTSFGPDGGIVSTSTDMLAFIEAFFTGTLFPREYVEELQQWNPIFFPLQAGVGIHRLKLPWFFDPTGAMPEIIGHSGLSGALAYYCPSKNLFIAGTVNQIAYRETSFVTALRLIQKILQ